MLLPISLSGRVPRSREKPAVTAEEIAAVELDHEDENLLDQMEQEADARGEDFDSEEEREKLKALKAEQAKQRTKQMRQGGHGSDVLQSDGCLTSMMWREGASKILEAVDFA